MKLTSKQRSYLKGLAMNIDSTFSLGKNSVTPEYAEAIREAFNTKEIIKINVLKNCMEDIGEVAETIADRTGATIVQVIGRKIILYKPDRDNPQIILPR